MVLSAAGLVCTMLRVAVVQHRATWELVEAVAACWLVIRLPKSPEGALGSFSLTFRRAQDVPLRGSSLYLLMSEGASPRLTSR